MVTKAVHFTLLMKFVKSYKLFFLVGLLLTCASLYSEAQVNRYIVSFKDKAGTPYSISNPSAFLSERAIQRRLRYTIPITEEDLPVSPAYVQTLRNTGVTVLYTSKWFNAALIECDQSQINGVVSNSFINSITLVAPGERPDPYGRVKSSNKFFVESQAGEVSSVEKQLTMIGLNKMHEAGYRGEGVFIGIMDSGFPGVNTISHFQHLFSENRFDAQTSYDFVSGAHNVFNNDSHGTAVLSIMAAYQEGSLIGGAYKAKYALFITEYAPTEYKVEEYNWLFAAERADSAGVDVVNTSLGYTEFDDAKMNYTKLQMDGSTAVITRAAEKAAKKGIVVVAAAGNLGGYSSDWQIISAPADGRNVLSVGAVTSLEIKASFSSTGPTADGRIKPDVCALGISVAVLWPNGELDYGNGTSFSSPLLASFVAGIRQKHPELTVEEVIDLVKMSSSRFTTPDIMLGYGVPNFLNVITSTENETVTSSVDIYPNPVVFNLVVEPTNPLLLSSQIRVINGYGVEQPVSFVYDNNKISIDVQALQTGVYFLKLVTGHNARSYKFIKTAN